MTVKMSTKGQIVLPAELRKKYKIDVGKEIEILDFGGEIVIVPIPETKGRGFIKFRRKLSDIIAEYKEEEKKREKKRR
ncbi:MAG: AbrB/MazE/SpoVT family DNA-binding domain-containing protein [Archaeoglobus sp.]|nr:AbrB/MazE/SpoVT family DNA-binding domain-containing protein [Archaeoglobus sp.]